MDLSAGLVEPPGVLEKVGDMCIFGAITGSQRTSDLQRRRSILLVPRPSQADIVGPSLEVGLSCSLSSPLSLVSVGSRRAGGCEPSPLFHPRRKTPWGPFIWDAGECTAVSPRRARTWLGLEVLRQLLPPHDSGLDWQVWVTYPGLPRRPGGPVLLMCSEQLAGFSQGSSLR